MTRLVVTSLVRIGLEVALLYVAWYHAHWSVALILTLLTVEVELRAIAREVGP